METTKVSIKLLVDKKANRVLFAEAGKDFVDFLFGLLSLPLGSVINLIRNKKMVGCLGNLYESVESFSSTYFQPNQNKDSLLNPNISFSAGNIPLLPPTTPPKYYKCKTRPCRNRHVTDIAGTRCPSCENQINNEISYVSPVTSKAPSSSTEGGIVKGVVTYMIMDDLVVTPMSTISSITLLNKFNVENVSYLEEKMVDISLDEGLELLRSSLLSTTVLTEVFLGTNKEKDLI